MDDGDVVVIGGGPAGSTAATALARKGHRVVLLERERFPREHIGESLLPASMPFLEWLGVMPAVEEAGFLKKWGATMVWGSSPEPWSWYFRETNEAYPHAYQVWRPKFDQLLLDNARKAGVDVREGCRVAAVTFEGQRATGVTCVDAEGRAGKLPAAWTVDASGHGAMIGHSRGLRRWDDFFQNMAVYGYFEGAKHLEPPDETNIFIESYVGGWFWNIPLHNGWMSCGAVVDSRAGQEGVRRLGPEGFLRQQVSMARGTRSMLNGARLVRGPAVVKDWSYLSNEVVGDGWILAGDAACFIDPLFSSGVHLAMMSGAMAAAYVTTALKDESMLRPGARFYKEQYLAEYNQFRAMARLFYSTNRSVESYFWEARRLLTNDGLEEQTPRQAFIRAVAGRPPRGYERVVIEQGEAPAGLVAEVRKAEGELVSRRRDLERWSVGRGEDGFMSLRPRLVAGARVQKQPRIEQGEFVWGFALSRQGEMVGREIDGLAANVALLSDGGRSGWEISRAIATEAAIAMAEVEKLVASSLRSLYMAGDVEFLPPSG